LRKVDQMIDKTRLEIARTLFAGSGTKTSPPDPRVDVLVAMVLDLMMEVEALRAAHLAPDVSACDTEAGYARAYKDTAYLTHNSSGPSSGLDKLLGLFYPAEADTRRSASGEQRTWRECLMLRRLGFSEEQVRVYKEEAARAETFT
jgi:hypothetical protein